MCPCYPLEDCPVFVPRRCPDFDLVGYAAQKSRIHQVGRRQVGGEYHELVERQGKTLASVQLEIVDAVLERDDPAVQHVVWAHQLTSEIVDDERTAERLYVQRGLVELGGVAPLQIEHVERELPAGDDDGPPAIDPPFIHFVAPDLDL